MKDFIWPAEFQSATCVVNAATVQQKIIEDPEGWFIALQQMHVAVPPLPSEAITE